MATCATCGNTILFGGARNGDLRYCNDDCAVSDAAYQSLIARVSDEEAMAAASGIQNGPCPVCESSHGPVDIRTAHRCMSFLLWSQWESPMRLSCRGCGIKNNLTNFVVTMLLGWWGFPWGLLVTPIQLAKNLFEIARSGNHEISEDLFHYARLQRALVLEAETPNFETAQVLDLQEQGLRL